ncbi:MAG: serine/threonine protein kinase, partial [Planctomycetales bacterium]
MAVANVEEFFQLLDKSKLLNPQQVQQARGLAGGDPQEAAQRLVQQELLTPWQAEQLLSGQTGFILGKYKLLSLLGAGGMGSVFKAQEQGGMKRVVAVKVMAKKLLDKPESVKRFLREVQAASALSHPNVVSAFDADKHGDNYFLVTEYVEGNDLNAWLKEYGRLPVEWSCECIRQALLGLQHAHERSLIHRDLKPANLMVVSAGTSNLPLVKIMDFGLARFTDAADSEHTDLTNTGQVLGTVDYISPEQATSTKHADIRSDVFSLGCALFKLVTGEVPFQGNSVTEKLFARARNARRAKPLRADLSDELDEIIAKMLALVPAERYQTPIETALALEPFCMTEDAESLRLAEQTATAVVADDAIQEFLGNLANESREQTETFAFTAEAERMDTLDEVVPASASPGMDKKKLMLLGSAGSGVLALLVIAFVLWQATRPVVALTLEIDQSSATVIVDGGSAQQSPSLRQPMTLRLTHGSHEIVVRKDG